MKTETVKVYGNCDMCKATIEKAGNLKKVAGVAWDGNTHMATLTYDSAKTNRDEILKRIALAGYDNEKFLAPDDVYSKLPGCCQYDRALKPLAENEGVEGDKNSGHSSEHQHGMPTAQTVVSPHTSQLPTLLDRYFSVKDALVKTDATSAAAQAVTLEAFVRKVNMDELSTEVQTVWTKVRKDIVANAQSISGSKDIAAQRKTFAVLSENIHELVKVSKQDTPVYYQHCPMYNGGKGANWLSREETVRNPYYGSQMLSCGSVKNTY